MVSSGPSQVHHLEKERRAQEALLEEVRLQMEELEDELQVAEDARLRVEVGAQALRVQHERDLQAAEQTAEEQRRQLLRQVETPQTPTEQDHSDHWTTDHIKYWTMYHVRN